MSDRKYKISWDLEGFEGTEEEKVLERLETLEARGDASHNNPDPGPFPEDSEYYPRVLTKVERKEFVTGTYTIQWENDDGVIVDLAVEG